MRKRLQLLNAAIQKVGEGDFTLRLQESTGSVDEDTRELEKSFNAMAEKLERRRDRLAELDTLKSDFVSSVSHELRTPLTTIKALTRLLLRGEMGEDKRREYLETISVEC